MNVRRNDTLIKPLLPPRMRAHTHTHRHWLSVCVFDCVGSLCDGRRARRVIKASSLFKAAQTLLCVFTLTVISTAALGSVRSALSARGWVWPLSLGTAGHCVWAEKHQPINSINAPCMTWQIISITDSKVREAASRCWFHNTGLMKATV